MAERYTRLYTLQENLYQEGSPILISAGVLLKDTSTGKLLVQLKFRNISDYVINAVKVKIYASDPAGMVLKGIESFSYLDLSVGKDGDFGQKKPIPLPDVTARSFSVEILSVTHSGGVYSPKTKDTATPAGQEVLEKIEALNHEREKQAKRENRLKDMLKKYSLLSVLLLILSFISYVLWFITYRFFSPNIQSTIRRIFHSPDVIFDLLILIGMLACIRLSPKIKKAPVIGIIFVAIMIILQIRCSKLGSAYLLSGMELSLFNYFRRLIPYWIKSFSQITPFTAAWHLMDIKNIMSVVVLIIFNKKMKAFEEV